jgi:hypothetical protein
MVAPKILFLYNHDAGHQVAHSIGIAAALAVQFPDIETTVAYGSDMIRSEIEGHLSDEQKSKLRWLDLALGGIANTLFAPLNRLFPARRLGRLIAGAPRLRRFDMIVSTERTCLMLKRRWGENGPQFVYIPHGSGDRNVAYHPALKDFDLMLLSGQKLVDQMVAHNIVPASKCRIIGYPKFDALIGKAPEKFFDNDNPVFLYNPHFDPVMSSWYDHGNSIVEWFYERADHYNLIFAPHVMLFFKKMHLSPEYKKGRIRPDIDPRFINAPNIRIDLDSPRLFDMSYTLSADAYIGDVSSQIYEFLIRPRACFFIDTHGGEDAGGNPAYEFWRNGPVAHIMDDLYPMLEQFEDIGTRYRADQVRLMDYTISIDPDCSAAMRGAYALAQAVGVKTMP